MPEGLGLEVVSFPPRQRGPVSARRLLAQGATPPRGLEQARAALAEPFLGITADGSLIPNLFPLRSTGVSTAPIAEAVHAFLAALGPEQEAAAQFGIDSSEWRAWSNIHPFLVRHGVLLEDLAAPQRDLALGVLRASLSTEGFASARDVMRLNDFIGELTGRWEEYGEWLYWLSIFGTLSADGPWGWQIDGHHLIINCFVLGDQIVMTPTFMGSEPVAATTGRHAGVRVFGAEELRGLELMQALTPDQQAVATIASGPPTGALTAAFNDNVQVPYQGVPYDALATGQQALLVRLLDIYIDRVRPGHAATWRDEVHRHLSHTYFAWVGSYGDEPVFYYRVQSPVILVEFDHQRGVALDSARPSRHHIHTVVRTPNGNDYGKNLLRQHYEQFAHVDGRHVARLTHPTSSLWPGTGEGPQRVDRGRRRVQTPLLTEEQMAALGTPATIPPRPRGKR